MNQSFNEKFIAYAALVSGLFISAVAIYFSVVGLAAIFAAASIPIIIMGLVLELSKLVASSWLKINWKIASFSIRCYLLIAIAVLMMITSIGSFGFLSRAHLDQASPIAESAMRLEYYDDRIKTARESIEINRKTLKQMDEAIDQVLSRSSDQKGAEKAISIRKSQLKERTQLINEIQTNQQLIEKLSTESAPLRASVQKIELEVGPIKYLAKFVYGDTNSEILEKAVTWIIIALIIVFDPLAVVLLLAAQTSFMNFKKQAKAAPEIENIIEDHSDTPEPPVKVNEILQPFIITDDETIPDYSDTDVIKVNKSIVANHPYLQQPFVHFKDLRPIVYKVEEPILEKESDVDSTATVTTITDVERPGDYLTNTKDFLLRYVQNEEQHESSLWSTVSTNTNITQQEYIKGSQEKGQ